MKTQLSGDEGREGEWAWSHLAGIGVGGWNSSSGCRRFPVFWQEGMDLVCGKAAVGELLQAVAEIETDVETGSLGAGEHGHDGGDGWPLFWVPKYIQFLVSPSATACSWFGLTMECGRHEDAAEWRCRKGGRVGVVASGRDRRGWVATPFNGGW